MVIDYNVLLRKTCEHKDKFICKCDHPPFDVLIGDFDYCHKTSAIISCPKNTGTEVFQTLSVSCSEMLSIVVVNMIYVDERCKNPDC